NAGAAYFNANLNLPASSFTSCTVFAPCMQQPLTCYQLASGGSNCVDPYTYLSTFQGFPPTSEFSSAAVQRMNGKRLESRTTTDGLGHSSTESYSARADFANQQLVTTTTLDDR